MEDWYSPPCEQITGHMEYLCPPFRSMTILSEDVFLPIVRVDQGFPVLSILQTGSALALELPTRESRHNVKTLEFSSKIYSE